MLIAYERRSKPLVHWKDIKGWVSFFLVDPIVFQGLDYIDDPNSQCESRVLWSWYVRVVVESLWEKLLREELFSRAVRPGHSNRNFCELLCMCPKWFLKGKQLRRAGTFTRYLWESKWCSFLFPFLFRGIFWTGCRGGWGGVIGLLQFSGPGFSPDLISFLSAAEPLFKLGYFCIKI